jgi:6-phosphogluconate dehydrogenase
MTLRVPTALHHETPVPGVPSPVLAAALSSRFGSRELDHFANQVLSAMREGFGGHDQKPAA